MGQPESATVRPNRCGCHFRFLRCTVLPCRLRAGLFRVCPGLFGPAMGLGLSVSRQTLRLRRSRRERTEAELYLQHSAVFALSLSSAVSPAYSPCLLSGLAKPNPIRYKRDTSPTWAPLDLRVSPGLPGQPGVDRTLPGPRSSASLTAPIASSPGLRQISRGPPVSYISSAQLVSRNEKPYSCPTRAARHEPYRPGQTAGRPR